MEQNELQRQQLEQQAYVEQLDQVERANLWSDIPMRKKAEIIRQAVQSGITDLEQIRQSYTSMLQSMQIQPNYDQGLQQNQDLQDQQVQVQQGQQQVNGYSSGGYINRYDDGGVNNNAAKRFYVDPAVYAAGQSSIQVQPLMSAEDIAKKRAIAVANEQVRQQQLRQQQQGTLRQGTFQGDGMTAQQRNQVMYNPNGVGDVVKGAVARNKMEYENGNSVWNGLEIVGKVAASSASGSAIGAIGNAGKVGQAVKTGYDIYKTGNAVKGVVDSYQSGDTWGVASNALGLVGKVPLNKVVQTGVKATSTAMKQVKSYGGKIKRRGVRCC